MFAKRAKGTNSSSPSKDFVKPSNFILKRAIATPLPDVLSLSSPTKPVSSPRRTLQPKSPVARLNTAMPKSSPISAPAGRSPTHGKRAGILNRRRTSAPFSRVDPPAFNLGGGAAPFSLDAALKGTISDFSSKRKGKARQSLDAVLEPQTKAAWTFEIHEDTPEQLMTNMLQHGTCVLDISSDEESQRKASRDRAEGRDKENVPPMDDVSQTTARRAPRLGVDDMVVEKERIALGEMNAADFFPEGCDETSVIFIAEDEEAETDREDESALQDFEFAPQIETAEPENVEALMAKPTDTSSKAAVLQPMEGTGESFDLWESESAKDETEVVAAVAATAAESS